VAMPSLGRCRFAVWGDEGHGRGKIVLLLEYFIMIHYVFRRRSSVTGLIPFVGTGDSKWHWDIRALVEWWRAEMDGGHGVHYKSIRPWIWIPVGS
jgi:hypothetical protein